MRLLGKVALVTGAAQGIGRAIVEVFAQEGASVVATDLNIAKLREIPQHPQVQIEILDVTDVSAIGVAAQRHGRVNVLVNCAGYVTTGSILEASHEDVNRSLQINVSSVFLMTQAFLPAMLQRKNGAIINIASVVSTIKAAASRCAYATSKGAVIALTKSVALDVIKHGVRCNCISPGTVHTPSLDERIAALPDPQEAMHLFIARQPLGRLGQAQEIAAAAVLLASEEAPFMTGSNLIIDGGFSL